MIEKVKREKKKDRQTGNHIMYIKHKSAMYILLPVITIVDFGFIIDKFYVISNIYATYSKSQIAFHSLSYSKYLQFFNNINF